MNHCRCKFIKEGGISGIKEEVYVLKVSNLGGFISTTRKTFAERLVIKYALS